MVKQWWFERSLVEANLDRRLLSHQREATLGEKPHRIKLLLILCRDLLNLGGTAIA